MTIKFMGEQDDPEMDNEGRGFPRIYDGTKLTLLDDVRAFLAQVADEGEAPSEYEATARQLLARIDGGER